MCIKGQLGVYINTKIFSTKNLFQDVIMDLIFTNNGFFHVGYENDLTYGCVKFHEPYAPVHEVGLGQLVICYYHDKI